MKKRISYEDYWPNGISLTLLGKKVVKTLEEGKPIANIFNKKSKPSRIRKKNETKKEGMA